MRLSRLIRRAEVRTPLYGHHDVNSAYLVDDYPYSFNLRTKIRYWLEHKPGKGWRFVSQTLNPKTQQWNKPKASTYAEWAAAMYLDEKDHVVWDGVTQYSDGEEILTFIKHFPKADMTTLKKVAPLKIKFLEQMISGERVFTVNGVPKPLSEYELEDYRKRLETWEEVGKHVH